MINIFSIYYPPVEKGKVIYEEFKQRETCFFINAGNLRDSDDPWVNENIIFETDYPDNLADWNTKINELTAQYLAWKNLLKNTSDNEWVRFSHYRRWLLGLPENLDNENIDIYLSNRYRCGSMEGWFKNCHPPLLHDIMEMYIKENSPTSDCVIFDEWKKLPDFIAPMNLAAMRLGLARQWWKWIFPKLFDIDKEIPYEEDAYRTLYQRRACGFMAERLFSFWVFLQQKKGLVTKDMNWALVDGLKPITMQQEMQTRI